jgi:hypothetical protein
MNDQVNKAENLSLWQEKAKPAAKATKKRDSNGNLVEAKDQNGNSSINSYYMFEAATDLFGPVGIGWGYEIVSEGREKGAPRVVEGNLLYEESHTLRLKLWYMRDGKRYEVENFGHTQAVYWVQKWTSFTYDPEAPKKSLTDAIKKCLSMIGVYSDVYKGMLEDFDYVQERKVEAELEHVETQQGKEEEVRTKLHALINEAEEFMNSCSTRLQTDPVLTKYQGLMGAYRNVNAAMVEKALQNLLKKHAKIRAEKLGVSNDK